MQRLFFAAACRAAAMKSTQRVGEVLLCSMKFADANEAALRLSRRIQLHAGALHG